MELDLNNHDPLVRHLVELQELCDKETAVPQSVKTGIKGALALWKKRSDYSEDITSKPSEELMYIDTETRRLQIDWKMITGRHAGQFLKSIIKLTNAKRVLEIGTFTGYSALAMAEALPADGTVDTCDIDPGCSSLAKQFTSRSKHGSKINFHVASGVDLLRKLAGEKKTFDLIFIDGNKDGYKDQYNIIMDGGLLSRGGAILFDNAYMDGYAFTEFSHPNQKFEALGRGVADLMHFLKSDNRVHKTLVPVRDGVVIVQRTSDI